MELAAEKQHCPTAGCQSDTGSFMGKAIYTLSLQLIRHACCIRKGQMMF